MFTPSNLFAYILFGAIGMGAFIYGKKQALLKSTVIGIALMVYPYFVPQNWLLWVIGMALSGSLFVFRG